MGCAPVAAVYTPETGVNDGIKNLLYKGTYYKVHYYIWLLFLFYYEKFIIQRNRQKIQI